MESKFANVSELSMKYSVAAPFWKKNAKVSTNSWRVFIFEFSLGMNEPFKKLIKSRAFNFLSWQPVYPKATLQLELELEDLPADI